jgi:hypothetical protein
VPERFVQLSGLSSDLVGLCRPLLFCRRCSLASSMTRFIAVTLMTGKLMGFARLFVLMPVDFC